MKMPVSYGHISKTNQYYDIDIMILKKKEEMDKKCHWRNSMLCQFPVLDL